MTLEGREGDRHLEILVRDDLGFLGQVLGQEMGLGAGLEEAVVVVAEVLGQGMGLDVAMDADLGPDLDMGTDRDRGTDRDMGKVQDVATAAAMDEDAEVLGARVREEAGATCRRRPAPSRRAWT